MTRCPECGNENRDGARFCDDCGTPLAAAQADVDPGTPGAPDQTPSAPPASEELPPGTPRTLANGRFTILRYLGQGGRKRVYVARDEESDDEVALALFETEGVLEASLARARREALAMERLGEHPHIVRVLHTGEEGGRPYMVSELMRGGEVASALAAGTGQGLGPERAGGIAADVCSALEHAHSRGVVHRDIKPANVWIGADGSARLGDFGLASTDRRSREAVEGMLVGTVAYLPPEQALGRPVDARSDLYSLGALLYEMLTGRPPFPGDDAVAIISGHLNSEAVPPSRVRPGLPRALDRVVATLLAKSPDDRPAGAAEARELITAALSGEGAEEEESATGEGANPLGGLAGGVFVGRETEISRMRAALEGALGGRGGLLLLTGEPGIGKTRTAEELATYARVRGAKVHWGRCHESDGAPPYWPWVEAIRSYVREADPVGLAWEIGPGAAEIARIVPELSERLPSLKAPSDELADSGQARFRLFDAISTFLTSASRSRPLVIVLDDLHWADEPSLLLLRFIARQLGDTGLLILGAYRDVELGRHHPLARTLGELSGTEGATRIDLRGLDRREIASYIELTTGAPGPEGLASAIFEQTEGNPFFVAEIVRLLAAEGAVGRDADPRAAGAIRPADGQTSQWRIAIPQGVREVIGMRLDGLGPEANRILRVAAAIGRVFSVSVLERVIENASPEDVERAVSAGLEQQVLTDAPPNRLCFAHALIRETLYAELDSPVRVTVHGRIAEALEAEHGDDESRLAELAGHFLEAAPALGADRAIDYAMRAADHATARLAHEDAVALMRRALSALTATGDPDRSRLLDVTLRLAAAETKASELQSARQSYDRAARLAIELDETDALVEAACGLSQTAEVGQADKEVLDVHRRALEAVGEEDSPARAKLLTGLAQQYVWVDFVGKARPMIEEAVAIARRSGDLEALAFALTRRQFMTDQGPDGGRERLANASEIHEIAKQLGSLELELRSHVYRLRDYMELGDMASADRESAAYERLANVLRQPQYLWDIPLIRGNRLISEGRFEEAALAAEEALRGGERAQEPVARQLYAIQSLLRLRHQGRVGELLATVREMARRYPAIPAWRCGFAQLATNLDKDEDAREVVEMFAPDNFAAIPRDNQFLVCLSSLSETVAYLGDEPRAAELYELLLPYDGLAIIVARNAACYGPVARLLGLLAHTLGRHDDAVRHYQDALEMAGRMGDEPWSVWTRKGLAEVLLDREARGDRDRAQELLGAALEAGQAHGMRRLVEEALRLRLRAQGIDTLDVTASIDVVLDAVSAERPDISGLAAPDGTVTIVFSDIESSTLLTERLGDERWIEVLREHNSIFREHVRANRGHEVKNQGDGFMLAFADPGDAIKAAIAIQSELAERDLAGSERLRVRMGIHTGEAIREGGDFFGRSVILAARVMGEACGGEVLVSEGVRKRVERNGSTFSFEEGRAVELKGLAGTHTVHALAGLPGSEPEPLVATPAA